MRKTVLLCLILFLATTCSQNEKKSVIIFDGNSLVSGYPENASLRGRNFTFPNGTDFPSVVMAQLGPDWVGYNVGVSARELDYATGDKSPHFPTQLAEFDEYVLPLIAVAKKSKAKKIIVINGGEPGNMLFNSPGGIMAQDESYEALRLYSEKVHKAGATFVNITMPNREPLATRNARLQEDIKALNERINNDCVKDLICDLVIPLDKDPRMTDFNDTRYYYDKAHFTVEGYKIWAQYVLKYL